ncbi:MAG: hypothetical protein SFX18_04350 [Pirellulales bacterium]|nr:hypothetical protein [Pirellulales bacterium]
MRGPHLMICRFARLFCLSWAICGAIELWQHAPGVVQAAEPAPPAGGADKKAPKKEATDQEADQEKPHPIKLAEAADHVGKLCVVEFKVLSSNLKNEKSPCFLNSKGNYKDKDNFQVVIFPKDLEKFKEAQIDDPALHFAGKLIRVTGKIEMHKGKPEIEIRDPAQIEIVEEKPRDDDAATEETAKPGKK